MIPIAHPLASKSLSERILGTVKEQLQSKTLVSGIRECQKAIVRNEIKGLMVFNAMTSPMDLITHMPILCEEKSIPYVFVENSEYLNGFTCVFLRDCQNYTVEQ